MKETQSNKSPIVYTALSLVFGLAATVEYWNLEIGHKFYRTYAETIVHRPIDLTIGVAGIVGLVIYGKKLIESISPKFTLPKLLMFVGGGGGLFYELVLNDILKPNRELINIDSYITVASLALFVLSFAVGKRDEGI